MIAEWNDEACSGVSGSAARAESRASCGNSAAKSYGAAGASGRSAMSVCLHAGHVLRCRAN